MADPPALVERFCRLDTKEEDREKCVGALSGLLAAGGLQLPALLGLMRPILTSGDHAQAARGTALLTAVLEGAGPITDPPSLAPTVDLLATALLDSFCANSAARGLTLLLQQHTVDVAAATNVATSLFAAQPAGLPASTRRTLLELARVLLTRFREAMQTIDSTVVQGFINLMDGERDPMNLLIAFDVHGTIMVSLDQTNLGYYHAELFDVVSCYFPITFTPLANDPGHVTPEALKAALARCMVFPEFASHCVPFLTDKLTAPIEATKLDALALLKDCARRYEYAVLAPYFADLWRVLRLEVVSQAAEEDKAVLQGLLECLALVVDAAVTNQPFEVAQESLAGLTAPILACASSFTGTSTASYASILHYSCAASAAACTVLAKIMVPKLRNLYLHAAVSSPTVNSSHATALTAITAADGGLTDSMKQRETTVILFVALLSAVRKLMEKETPPSCRLGPVVDILLECLLTKSTPIIERAALEGVGYCAIILSLQQEPIVPPHHEEALYTLLTSVYINTGDDGVQQVALRTLASVGAINPKALTTTVCPALAPLLSASSMRLELGLTALKTLSACPPPPPCSPPAIRTSLAAHVVAMVLGILHEAVQKNDVDDKSQLCSALCDIISSLEPNATESTTSVPMMDLTMKVFSTLWCRANGCQSEDAPLPEAVFSLASALQRLLAFGMSSDQLRVLVGQMVDSTTEQHYNITPFDHSNPRPCQLLLLKAALAACPPPALPPPDGPILILIDTLLRVVSADGDGQAMAASSSRQLAIYCLAILLNKAPESVLGSWHSKMVSDSLLPKLRPREAPERQRLHALAAVTWAWKALAMRAASVEADGIGDLLLALIADSGEVTSIRHAAAAAFEAVLSPAPLVLSKELHAVVKFLWDQKFFSHNVAQLKEISTQAKDAATHMHAFCAMSGLVKPCREAILLSHLPQLMPLLIQQLKTQAHKHQLDVEDSSTKPYVLSTLGTLQSIFAANPATMKEHFADTLEPLLVFSTYMHSTQARLTSLQILNQFASIPFQFTRPHKAMITQRLRPALDDPKRVIRRSATDARHKWFSLTDPETRA